MAPANLVVQQAQAGGKQVLQMDEEPEVALEATGNAEGGWRVEASAACLRTTNPIRSLTDSMRALPPSAKNLISLSLGDPTVFGNLPPPPEALAALLTVIKSGGHNGYTNSAGLPQCRAAVANYHNRRLRSNPLQPEDVIVTVGCTQALQLCLAVLANPGVNVLLPRPGFSPYQSFCEYYGIEPRFYDLVPERGWEVDLAHVAQLADSKTAALLICNPGNPSGSNFSREHLLDIAKAAERLRVPIISDEIYADMVFGDQEFHPMASVASGVPVLTAGGISKRWLIPGWRLGWILVSDCQAILARGQVPAALNQLMQLNIGTSTIVQAAVPEILERTPPEFFRQTMRQLEGGADYVCKRVCETPGLDVPCLPQASMFLMVRIQEGAFPGISNDIEFASKLLEEEAVIILPGSIFGVPGWFRVVYVAPLNVLEAAFDRIQEFCKRHCQCATAPNGKHVNGKESVVEG